MIFRGSLATATSAASRPAAPTLTARAAENTDSAITTQVLAELPGGLAPVYEPYTPTRASSLQASVFSFDKHQVTLVSCRSLFFVF